MSTSGCFSSVLSQLSFALERRRGTAASAILHSLLLSQKKKKDSLECGCILQYSWRQRRVDQYSITSAQAVWCLKCHLMVSGRCHVSFSRLAKDTYDKTTAGCQEHLLCSTKSIILDPGSMTDSFSGELTSPLSN